jgi:hypothetical protein
MDVFFETVFGSLQVEVGVVPGLDDLLLLLASGLLEVVETLGGSSGVDVILDAVAKVLPDLFVDAAEGIAGETPDCCNGSLVSCGSRAGNGSRAYSPAPGLRTTPPIPL